MAVPILKRASDNVVLCDKVVAWTDWDWIFSYALEHTIGGVPYEDSKGAKYRATQVRLRFSPSYANATPAKYDSIIRALARKQDLKFTDVYGDTYTVRVSGEERPRKEFRNDIRSKNIFEVELTLRLSTYEAV